MLKGARLGSSRLVSSRLVSCRLVSPRLISSRLAPLYYEAEPDRTRPCTTGASGTEPNRTKQDQTRPRLDRTGPNRTNEDQSRPELDQNRLRPSSSSSRCLLVFSRTFTRPALSSILLRERGTPRPTTMCCRPLRLKSLRLIEQRRDRRFPSSNL